MAKPKFIQQTYDNGVKPTVIHLSRKQVQQMAQMVENFKDVEDFELHVTHDSGIGTGLHFRFTLDLSGDPVPMAADVTDVSKW